jgi:hypothetical protein
MFVLRSLFWLMVLVLFLPAAPDGGQPPPRVNLIHAMLAARVLVEDMTGVCEREAAACATSREALALFKRKLETGAEAVASLARSGPEGISSLPESHGTLRPEDLEPDWFVGRMQPAS